MDTRRLRVLLASLLLLASVSPAAAGEPPGAGTAGADVSPAFRACYAEAKSPWLVDILSPPGASSAELERALFGLGARSAEAVERAKSYVIRRREGGYQTSQVMAAAAFLDCMSRSGAARHSMSRSVACFRDQRLLLVALDMRFEQKLSEVEARAKYLANNSHVPRAAQESALRAIHDAYAVLAPGEERAFFEAEFQLCMDAR